MTHASRTQNLINDHGAEWRRLYDAGHGLDGIACIVAAKGISVSPRTVRRGIIAAGGVLREGRSKSIQAATAVRRMHTGAAIEARRAAK